MPFSPNLTLSSAKSFRLEMSKICCLGKREAATCLIVVTLSEFPIGAFLTLSQMTNFTLFQTERVCR